MKTRTVVSAFLIAAAFISGQAHGRKVQAAADVNDEFTAQMYEAGEDDRAELATKSGNEKAFLAGFDFAVKQADEILNGGH